jgi:capsule polysaccharide export protein KpsE/RkpR
MSTTTTHGTRDEDALPNLQRRFLEAEHELRDAITALEQFRSSSQILDEASGSVKDATLQLVQLSDRLRDIGTALTSGADALRKGIEVLEQADVGRLERAVTDTRNEMRAGGNKLRHDLDDRMRSFESAMNERTNLAYEGVQSLGRSMDERFVKQEVVITRLANSMTLLRGLALGSIVLLAVSVIIGAFALRELLAR